VLEEDWLTTKTSNVKQAAARTPSGQRKPGGSADRHAAAGVA
jgi:hypothetical protein